MEIGAEGGYVCGSPGAVRGTAPQPAIAEGSADRPAGAPQFVVQLSEDNTKADPSM